MRVFFSIFFLLFPLLSFPQTYTIFKGDTINKIDKNGYRQGKWIFFEKNYKDSISVIGYYKDGQKNGLWTYFYPNGNIKAIITYSNNKKEGPVKLYYENGKLEEEGYWKGTKWVGEYKRYYPNGKLQYHWFYDKTGRRTGKQEYFYENGKKYIEGEWKDGKENGEMKEYYTNGKIKKITHWLDGSKNGKEIQYAKDGRKIFETYYINGSEDPSRRLVYNDQNNENSQPVDTLQTIMSSSADSLNLFQGTGYFKIYSTNKKYLIEEGYFQKGHLINGKKYKYDNNGKVIKIIIYKRGRPQEIVKPYKNYKSNTDTIY